MDSQEPVGKSNAVWLARDQLLLVTEYRASHFDANDRLFDQYLCVELTCGFDCTQHVLLSDHLADAKR